MMYNKIVQDCFFLPRHVGEIDCNESLSVHFRGNKTNQGLIIDLYMQCAQDGVITKICFKTNGNPYIIASLEWLCRRAQGMKLDSLVDVNYKTLIDVLEIPVNQSPVALYVDGIYKAVLALMKKKFER